MKLPLIAAAALVLMHASGAAHAQARVSKERIARAADLRGMALSAFVRDAVLREAQSVTAAELTVTLSADESRRFLKALDAPFAPNAKLKKALARVAKS